MYSGHWTKARYDDAVSRNDAYDCDDDDGWIDMVCCERESEGLKANKTKQSKPPRVAPAHAVITLQEAAVHAQWQEYLIIIIIVVVVVRAREMMCMVES